MDYDSCSVDESFEQCQNQRDKCECSDVVKDKRYNQYDKQINRNRKMQTLFTDSRVDSAFAEEDPIESAGESGFLPFVKSVQKHEYDTHLTQQ